MFVAGRQGSPTPTPRQMPPSKVRKTETVNVCMFGTGEYTTGFVGGGAADSDKGTGVVGLVMLDLRRRGIVKRLGMCGVNGKKLPAIRAHMQRVSAVDGACCLLWRVRLPRP